MNKLEFDHNSGIDPMRDLPSPKFSKKILVSVVGDAKANQVLQSMSMNMIPKIGSGSLTAGVSDRKFLMLLSYLILFIHRTFGMQIV